MTEKPKTNKNKTNNKKTKEKDLPIIQILSDTTLKKL